MRHYRHSIGIIYYHDDGTEDQAQEVFSAGIRRLHIIHAPAPFPLADVGAYILHANPYEVPSSVVVVVAETALSHGTENRALTTVLIFNFFKDVYFWPGGREEGGREDGRGHFSQSHVPTFHPFLELVIYLCMRDTPFVPYQFQRRRQVVQFCGAWKAPPQPQPCHPRCRTW